MKKLFLVLGAGALAPVMTFAQGRNSSGDVGGLVTLFGNLVSMLIPIASMLAILFFFYGLAIYILHAGDPDKAAEGKSIMIWGILALFVMTSIYGIIGFLQRSSGTDQAGYSNTIVVPSVQTGSVR